MECKYTVNFESNPDGTITAWVPTLGACVTEGHTMAEAEQRIKEAIACHIEGLLAENKEIPVEGDTIARSVSVEISAA